MVVLTRLDILFKEFRKALLLPRSGGETFSSTQYNTYNFNIIHTTLKSFNLNSSDHKGLYKNIALH